METYPPAFIREEVGGVKVEKDEVLPSALSFKTDRHGNMRGLVPIHSTRKLTLANGEVVYGCRECPFAGTLGQVRQHLNADHGTAYGMPRASAEEAAAAGTAAVEKVGVPTAYMLGQTLRWLLEQTTKIEDYEDAVTAQDALIGRLQQQLIDAKQEASAAKKELASVRRKLRNLVGD